MFEAYRKLDQFDDSRPLKPWLFQIAHNRCIDLLRRRGARSEAETAAMEPDIVEPAESAVLGLGRAVEHLVISLPPKERACVLLKDVFDYSLEETADLVDSTVGGVKAALNRGRSRLATLPQPSRKQPRAEDPELSRILHLYVERFNRQDWDGLRELISADARLQVGDRFFGAFVEAGYLGVYSRWKTPLRMAVGELDGELVIITHSWEGGRWIPSAPIHLEVAGGRITRMVDYIHCPWVLTAAASVVADEIQL